MILPKTVTIIVSIILSVLILIGLFRQINSALEAGKRLDLQAEEVAKLQARNRELKTRLNEVGSYDYIEEIARDKLNQSKPSEVIVVIPQEAIQKVLAADIKVEEVKVPHWQGWLRLFKIPI